MIGILPKNPFTVVIAPLIAGATTFAAGPNIFAASPPTFAPTLVTILLPALPPNLPNLPKRFFPLPNTFFARLPAFPLVNQLRNLPAFSKIPLITLKVFFIF